MTSLAVQSSILGVAGHGAAGTLPMAAAGSLALGVFRDARNANGNLHAPNRRRRNPDTRNTPRKMTAPATNLYSEFLKLPQAFRFAVAGNLGNIGFFYLEKVIFRLLSQLVVTTDVLSSILMDTVEKYQDQMSFFSAYTITIVITHLLYAFLVYGMDTINTYEKYSKTLSGQFKVYGFGLFGATFLNSFLMSSGGLSKTLAFWATTAIFAVFNYFLVSWVVEKAIESSASSKDPASGKVQPSRRR